MSDAFFMQEAIHLAKFAALQGEVPVGAVIVYQNQVIAKGFNQPISTHDPCAHAEIIALRQAGLFLQNYRLLETTLYVTLEPCQMCVGAILHARIARLVFGAFDSRVGMVVNGGNLQRLDWEGGVLEEECGGVIQAFFQERRKSG